MENESEYKYPYTQSEKIIMVLFTFISHIFLLPGLFLMKYQKRNYCYYLSIFTFVCSLLYNICESLDIIIFVSFSKWNELVNIGVVSCVNSLLISITKFYFDKNEQKMMNYFALFMILVFQKRGPFNLINAIVPIFIIILFVLYKLVKYGIPKYNKGNLIKGHIFFVIGMILFYFSFNHNSDYMNIYHFLSHIFEGISFFYLWQIQMDNSLSIKDIYNFAIGKKNNLIEIK
jgi:hypothetical protein